jgi:hypothetical protein
MIIGAHSIIYSKDSDADRAFLRDVLGFPNVDVGDGWLIFGLPPAEVAVHPSDENGVHELYLMTDDVEALVAAMQARGVATEPISNQGWGMLTQLTLPGGGRLGVYQPRHARPPQHAGGGEGAKAKAAAPTRKKAKKGSAAARKVRAAAPNRKKAKTAASTARKVNAAAPVKKRAAMPKKNRATRR